MPASPVPSRGSKRRPPRHPVRSRRRSHEAQAQSGRTVRAIVPTPPAGVNDLMARLVGDYLGKTHGLSMVVENRAGAAEVIGTEAVARAAPRRQYDSVWVFAGRHQSATPEGELSSAGKLRADLPDGGGAARHLGPKLVAPPHPQRPARRRAREARQRDDGEPRSRHALRHRACDAQERDQGRHHLRTVQRQWSVDQRAFGRTRNFDVQQLFQHFQPAQSGLGRPLATASKTRIPPLPDVPTVTKPGSKDRGRALVRRLRAGKDPKGDCDAVRRLAFGGAEGAGGQGQTGSHLNSSTLGSNIKNLNIA